MKSTKWVVFAVAFPYTILMWLLCALMYLAFIIHGLRLERDGTITAEWREWVTRPRGSKKKPLWRWSTTFGHFVVFQPGLRYDPNTVHAVITQQHGKTPSLEVIETTSTWDHEFIHILQSEDLMMISFLVGLVVALVVGIGTGDWSLALWLGAGLWTSGGLWQAVWFLTAGLRYGWTLEGVYRQSEHERSARAQTQRWCRGSSWLQKGNL